MRSGAPFPRRRQDRVELLGQRRYKVQFTAPEDWVAKLREAVRESGRDGPK
jgi:hypothetical protein